jgi:hypothetical protein
MGQCAAGSGMMAPTSCCRGHPCLPAHAAPAYTNIHQHQYHLVTSLVREWLSSGCNNTLQAAQRQGAHAQRHALVAVSTRFLMCAKCTVACRRSRPTLDSCCRNAAGSL